MLLKADEHPINPVFDPEAGALAQRFPGNFAWGVATSAYQIEGAVHEDGRGDSIWDVFCRRPGAIKDGSSGERACDHYHRAREDIALIASLGVKAYRFSLAWPRVQPLGAGDWNEKGFDFYDRLIDGLLEQGIAPHLTLYHWDLPQALQESGGWMNRDAVGRFADYAAEVARRFGGRAASIATHNEPWVVAILGHEAGIFAPGLKSQKAAMQVSHHLLLSHGVALQALRAQHCSAPLGIVLNQAPIHAATNSPDDLAKARLDDGLTIRWYMDALLRGTYPQDVLAFLGEDAPQIAPGDMATIRQPLDFLGINYYTRNLSGTGAPLGPVESGKEVTDMGWEVFPGGLSELLMRLRADYRLPPLYVMENGAAYRDRLVDGRVADADRIRYLHRHIAAMADAIESGVDVRGYFVWSLLDNFEWADGYSKRFGLVYVDYATQRRTLKDSALWYRAFCSRAMAEPSGPLRRACGDGVRTMKGASRRWKLVWSDEFDGGQLDATKWDFELGNGFFDYKSHQWVPGWGNEELQYYTREPDNVSVRDSLLYIRALKEPLHGCGYTSARIRTRKRDGTPLFSQRYGKFEFRARVPHGKGLWPAIWLLPQDDKYGGWAASGEIDVMEIVGEKPHQYLGTVHFGSTFPKRELVTHVHEFPAGQSVAEFHVYAVEWEPGEIRWSVDGEVWATQTFWWSCSKLRGGKGIVARSSADLNPWPAPFDQPFYIVMNVAVGGNFPGVPNPATQFPAELVVDYVRVYDRVGGYGKPAPRGRGRLPYQKKR